MKRYLSLDLLRGLSIFGMVFSAIVPSGVLPAWMYHIQSPPPTHVLDRSISGISWVDLVFPIFIFCMGVAIPLAGRRHLENSGSEYVKEIFERFFMLWLFSYLYVFLNFSTAGGWGAQLATLIGFLALFPVYLVFPKEKQGWLGSAVQYKKWIRICGMILVIAIITFGHFVFGEEIALRRSGIIIFLLAFLYLFGSLIWYFTRDSVKGRSIAFVLILIFTVGTMILHLPEKIYAIKEIKWFVNMEYIYFLLILIPATYIGDLLQKKISVKEGYSPIIKAKMTHLIVIVIFAFIVWLMVALYNNYLLINFVVSAIMSVIIWFMIKKHLPVYLKETILSGCLIIAGLIALFIEGSITKVPCSVSYCFVTAGISIFLLMIMDYVSSYAGNSIVGFFSRIFSGAGSNPLMSYIAFGAFFIPLLKLTGMVVIYQAAFPHGYPWIGVGRAFLAVLLTMSMVAYMSERKIFWRA